MTRFILLLTEIRLRALHQLLPHLVWAFSSCILYSQPTFTNYDERSGLPVGEINHIVQDHNGYIWMGCSNGLLKFDGYSFDHFIADGVDTNALGGNDISALEVAPDGKIWVGTHDNGLSIYNPKTGVFRRSLYDPEKAEDLLNSAIRAIHFSKNGKIWIATTAEGLWHAEEDPLKYSYLPTPGLTGYIGDIIDDPADSNFLYLGTRSGLWHCNIETQDISILEENWTYIGNLASDRQGRIWGKRYSGSIAVYDPKTNQAISYDIGDDVHNPSMIYDSSSDQIWLSSVGKGIRLFDIESESWSSIHPAPFENRSIPSKLTFGLMVDRQGLKWIGTKDGISMLDPKDQIFTNVPLSDPVRNQIIEVHGIHPWHETGKYLVASSQFNQVAIVDPRTKSMEIILRSDQANHLIGPVKIYYVNGKYWVIYYNGVGFFKPDEKKIYLWTPSTDSDIFKTGFIINSALDGENLWLVKNEKILIQIRTNIGRADTFHLDRKGIDGLPRSIFVHSSGLWIGMENGAMLFNPITKVKKYFTNDIPKYRIWTSALNDIIIDHSSNMWITTWRNALFKTQYISGELEIIKRYDIHTGLASNRPGDLALDDKGVLYVSTDSGFSIYDNTTDRFRSFGTKDGMLSQRTGLAIYDSIIYLNHPDGFSYVPINNLHKSSERPNVIFRRIMLGDSTFQVSQDDQDKSIVVPYNQNDFLVEYISLHFEDPLKVRYQYRLAETDQWIAMSSSERTIRYANLDPGQYQFEIRASVDDVHWGLTNSILFLIAPPIWKTIGFRSLAVLSIGGLIILLFRFRETRLRVAENTRTRIAELELKALRSQMNPHFMFNSLNAIKNYILKSKPAEAAQYLSSFAHLIRMTLENSKEQTISLSQELETLMLYIELEKLRFKKGFQFTCEVDHQLDTDSIQMPPLILQPYIENAIWHGLMHKEDDAILSVSVKKSDERVQCIIEDNGIGREASEKIQSMSARKYKSLGMGITKDRIDIHNRMSELGIAVEIVDKANDMGKANGTRVTLSMPLK